MMRAHEDPKLGPVLDLSILNVLLSPTIKTLLKAIGFHGMLDDFIKKTLIRLRLIEVADEVSGQRSPTLLVSARGRLPRSRIFSMLMSGRLERYYLRIFDLFSLIHRVLDGFTADYARHIP
ncbi:MAG: hypothetical protein Q8P67_23485 [archaeon]|nr:hypothetical protein [archaeon]